MDRVPLNRLQPAHRNVLAYVAIMGDLPDNIQETAEIQRERRSHWMDQQLHLQRRLKHRPGRAVSVLTEILGVPPDPGPGKADLHDVAKWVREEIPEGRFEHDLEDGSDIKQKLTISWWPEHLGMETPDVEPIVLEAEGEILRRQTREAVKEAVKAAARDMRRQWLSRRTGFQKLLATEKKLEDEA